MKYLMLAGLALLTGSALAAEQDVPLPTDQKFLVKAIECTVAEVKFAETALQRSTNGDVKQLAQQLKTDHEQCLKKFLAAARNEKLAVVEGLDKEHRQIADRLGQLEGKPFDQEYVRGVIERHQKAIQMCESQIKDGKNQEIVTMCKDALPKLKAHLEEARKLQEKLKG